MDKSVMKKPVKKSAIKKKTKIKQDNENKTNKIINKKSSKKTTDEDVSKATNPIKKPNKPPVKGWKERVLNDFKHKGKEDIQNSPKDKSLPKNVERASGGKDSGDKIVKEDVQKQRTDKTLTKEQLKQKALEKAIDEVDVSKYMRSSLSVPQKPTQFLNLRTPPTSPNNFDDHVLRNIMSKRYEINNAFEVEQLEKNHMKEYMGKLFQMEKDKAAVKDKSKKTSVGLNRKYMKNEESPVEEAKRILSQNRYVNENVDLIDDDKKNLKTLLKARKDSLKYGDLEEYLMTDINKEFETFTKKAQDEENSVRERIRREKFAKEKSTPKEDYLMDIKKEFESYTKKLQEEELNVKQKIKIEKFPKEKVDDEQPKIETIAEKEKRIEKLLNRIRDKKRDKSVFTPNEELKKHEGFQQFAKQWKREYGAGMSTKEAIEKAEKIWDSMSKDDLNEYKELVHQNAELRRKNEHKKRAARLGQKDIF